MRTVVVVGLAAAGALVAAAQFAPAVFDIRLHPGEPAASSGPSTVAAHRALARRDDVDLQLIVIGRALSEDVLEFRAQAMRGEGASPAYGRVQFVCDAEDARVRDVDACWRLTLLEIDGVVVADASASSEETSLVSETPASAISDTEQAWSTSAAEGGELPTGVIVASDAPAQEALAALESAPEDVIAGSDEPPLDPLPVAATPPAPTHEVAASNVNARSGPGRDFDVVAVLDEGVGLVMLPSDAPDGAAWRRYEVVSGRNDGARVWIFGDLARVLSVAE